VDILYRIRVLGFIFQVATSSLEAVKNEVIEAISPFREEDTAYLHHPERNLKLLSASEETSHIVSYLNPVNYNIQNAIKDTVFVIEGPPGAHRHVFFITDRYDKEIEYGFKMGLNYDLKHENDCSFSLCGIGSKYDKSLKNMCKNHPRCSFVHFRKVEKLSEYIIEVYSKMERNKWLKQ